MKIENERLLSKRAKPEPEIDFDEEEIEAAMPAEKKEAPQEQITEQPFKRQKLDENDNFDQNPESNPAFAPAQPVVAP